RRCNYRGNDVPRYDDHVELLRQISLIQSWREHQRERKLELLEFIPYPTGWHRTAIAVYQTDAQRPQHQSFSWRLYVNGFEAQTDVGCEFLEFRQRRRFGRNEMRAGRPLLAVCRERIRHPIH